MNDYTEKQKNSREENVVIISKVFKPPTEQVLTLLCTASTRWGLLFLVLYKPKMAHFECLRWNYHFWKIKVVYTDTHIWHGHTRLDQNFWKTWDEKITPCILGRKREGTLWGFPHLSTCSVWTLTGESILCPSIHPFRVRTYQCIRLCKPGE